MEEKSWNKRLLPLQNQLGLEAEKVHLKGLHWSTENDNPNVRKAKS